MRLLAVASVFVVSIPGIGKAYSLDRAPHMPPSCTVAHASLLRLASGGLAEVDGRRDSARPFGARLVKIHGLRGFAAARSVAF